MYTLIQLSQFTKTELQSICIDYGIKSSGNMSALITRIRFHQEKIQKEEEVKKQLLEYGANPRCDGFEKIIRAFELWCSKEGFSPFQGYITTEKVDINTTEQDREFDCDSMYNSNWMARGMTEIYNTL